jgi:hypothetical protein
MNKFAHLGSNLGHKQENEGQTGSSGGQTDYLDKGQFPPSDLDALTARLMPGRS